VDRGSVVRQGPIADLLAGTSVVIQIGCSHPDRARDLLTATAFGADVATEIVTEPTGFRVSLPAGSGDAVISEINRVLVEGGISVHRLFVVQASLETWFLQVTTRLGEGQ
jgi:hypothetical protein